MRRSCGSNRRANDTPAAVHAGPDQVITADERDLRRIEVCLDILKIIGVVLAIFLAFNHRRRVLRDYERQLSPKRTEFSQNLEKQFAKAIDAFCAEMAKKLQDLKEICQTQRRRYEPGSQHADELQTKFTELKPRLG